MRFLIRSVLDDPSILYKVTYCVIRLYKDWRNIFLLKIMKFNCFPEKKNLDDFPVSNPEKLDDSSQDFIKEKLEDLSQAIWMSWFLDDLS